MLGIVPGFQHVLMAVGLFANFLLCAVRERESHVLNLHVLKGLGFVMNAVQDIANADHIINCSISH